MRVKNKVGVADARDVAKEFNVPMVIIRANKTKENYEGFVPGINFSSVFGNSEQEVQEKLKNKTVSALKELAINNLPLPFFPSGEEIKKDFENVVKIIYLKIKT